MQRPIWFEIPADEVPRAVQFYREAFGWEFNKLPWHLEYWIARLPMAPMSVMGGAIMSREGGSCTRNTIAVPSLDECFARIEQAGGKVLTEKLPIPAGLFAVAVDTEGNELGLLEPPAGSPPPEVEANPDHVPVPVHFDYPVTEVERALAFYRTVFGWEATQWEDQQYWLLRTGPETELGLNGALHPRDSHRCLINTFAVLELEASLARVQAAGGKVLGEKMRIPRVGWLAECEDTEGNEFGLLQPERE